MKVSELIAALSELPPDLVVVHSTGTMQDREVVDRCVHGEPGSKMWSGRVWVTDGEWIEIV